MRILTGYMPATDGKAIVAGFDVFDQPIILSPPILPEVSQTCQRVVIINKGRVVAVDTPDNLTARLRGAATLYVQVDAGDADAASVLSHVPGVARVAESERRNGLVG